MNHALDDAYENEARAMQSHETLLDNITQAGKVPPAYLQDSRRVLADEERFRSMLTDAGRENDTSDGTWHD